MNSEKACTRILHITFSKAAFDVVSAAVGSKAIAGSCILINGDWHLGPLKNRNTQTLTTWFIDNFGYPPDHSEARIPIITIDESAEIYTWIDALSSEEYSNFLNWISTFRIQQFFMISITSPPYHLAHPTTEDFSESLDRAVKIGSKEISSYIDEWNVLLHENADFRLIGPDGKIQPFTSSSFDEHIINAMATDWERSPSLVLRIMANLQAGHQQFPGDIFLYQRLEKFVANGVIEKQTNSTITQTSVRPKNPQTILHKVN
ncbi:MULTISPECIES: DUF3658 domain-containing protein [Burkholderia]|uniref:DUF3658 domain-containing protein n=1 Tax=Burkholderia paludis TaxID=1506587 RepID=A0A6J5E1W7_9BURK|nr:MULTISPECIES: DUF3658 domain-containing protein [Burkholderia]CAB3759246.1 hypothetical protein LMG30113_03413 [Burkholderia paludis]VWB54075.1 hypothetical protein BPA30113_02355 [Burkholderia paludis]